MQQLQSKYIADSAASQEILHDESATGRERPWRTKKMANELLAMAYDDVDTHKAERLRGCADYLRYAVGPDGRRRLVSANFCRVRLCPVCAWRRSLKCYVQCRQVMDALSREGRNYRYILVTLTIRNVSGDELGQALDRLTVAYNRLTKYAEIQRAVQGYYKGVEVTHNLTDDTYHPHIHALCAVKQSYFKGRDYLSHDRWAELWQRALKVDYAPIIDVRRCKGETAAAVAEVAKYAVKDADYIIPDDWDMTIDTVRLLDKVLNKRRFVGFGGALAEMHARLHLDDTEDGDLLHVDDDGGKDATPMAYIDYIWHTGYKQYYGV